MKRFIRLVAALVLLGVAAPAFAQDDAPPLDPADKAAIRQVIQKQMDAFQKDDGVAAFNFATPALRERFHTPEIFLDMVRKSYQPVYRPSQVTFGGVEDVAGTKVQHVLLVGPDGNLHEALYFMEHEQDGTWLIDGCALLKSDQTTS